MTTVRFEPRLGFLSVAGHAGAAPRGRDLVCAALSVLAETAAALPGAKTRRGMGWRVVRADPQALRPLALGFRLLARDYPEYVEYVEDEA